jgi:hypothetical protein
MAPADWLAEHATVQSEYHFYNISLDIMYNQCLVNGNLRVGETDFGL